MKRWNVAAWFGILLLGSCASPRLSSFPGQDIAPLESREGGLGTLVATVVGQPRDIVYYINGVRVEPNEEIRWWEDARLEIELRPGFYEVEARYKVRAFAKERTRYRIQTHRPIGVLSNRTTYLEAEIQKDWRGVPLEDTAAFQIIEGVEHHPEAPSGYRRDSPQPGYGTDFVPVFCDLELDDQQKNLAWRLEQEARLAQGHWGPELPTIRIDAEGGRIEGPSRAHAALPGAGVRTPRPPRSTADVGQPFQPSVAQATDVWVAIASRPGGASAFVDGRSLGQTPLEVRMDPAKKHEFRFLHPDCLEWRQVVAANTWRGVERHTILVQPYCP